MLSGRQMVVATPATFSTSGCGAPTFRRPPEQPPCRSPTAPSRPTELLVSVRVSVPATPTTGTYVNTSNISSSVGSTPVTAPREPRAGHLGSPARIAVRTDPGAVDDADERRHCRPSGVLVQGERRRSGHGRRGRGISSSIETLIGNPVNSWARADISTAASLTLSNNDLLPVRGDDDELHQPRIHVRCAARQQPPRARLLAARPPALTGRTSRRTAQSSPRARRS